MSAYLSEAHGRWSGEMQLFRPWISAEPASSASEMVIGPAAEGRFLSLSYDWSLEGERQSGLMLIKHDVKGSTIKAVWIDSYHMSGDFMVSTGVADDPQMISVLGSYAAPPGPDWGWRTVIAEVNNGVEFSMFNITPDGEESIAVRASYHRR
jgi:hypothetical protein